ncbi:MAG: hypothetical protein ACRDOL_22630 [Streptosporangiaceae bacterium]
MTTAAEGVPYDPANTLLAETRCLLFTSYADADGSPRLVLTIRTASTTLTVLLTGAEAKDWAAHLARAAAGMSETGLIAAGGGIAKPSTPKAKAPEN